ncbi:MAG: hypothetical protein ACREC5_00790 [Thermoplasmata archaeon]
MTAFELSTLSDREKCAVIVRLQSLLRDRTAFIERLAGKYPWIGSKWKTERRSEGFTPDWVLRIMAEGVKRKADDERAREVARRNDGIWERLP